MARSPRNTLVLAALLAAACSNDSRDLSRDGPPCEASVTPISTLQGTDARSDLAGRLVDVRGVVTHVDGDGAFIESGQPDHDPRTSEGLFLALAGADTMLGPGDVVGARGTLTEHGDGADTQTRLAAVSAISLCGEHRPLPLTQIRLPLDAMEREALENMRVALDSASVVTDVYRLADGRFQVALDGPLPSPTEVAWPGADARMQRARNRDLALQVQLHTNDPAVFSIGTELVSDLGVLGHDGRGLRLLLESRANLERNAIPTLPPPTADSLRVVNLNLQNYFNGDGEGGGFPTSRGAESPREFEAQRRRFVALLRGLQPDIVAVQELENDGFDERGAAADFTRDLAEATGHEWRAVAPDGDRIGHDEIAVGLFHRPDRVVASGAALTLDAAPFDLLSRTPLAQVFTEPSTGSRFLVAVNHFKSKGRCPEQGADRDLGDGQGCWNAARLAAARAVSTWVADLARTRADGHALITGDLNAYRLEDPVRHLVDAGFEDLTGGTPLGHEYSYVYYGESGTLDHALATPALRRSVSLARILHVNAGWPRGMPLERDWLGSSDHDPVVVDLRFRQPLTSP